MYQTLVGLLEVCTWAAEASWQAQVSWLELYIWVVVVSWMEQELCTWVVQVSLFQYMLEQQVVGHNWDAIFLYAA